MQIEQFARLASEIGALDDEIDEVVQAEDGTVIVRVGPVDVDLEYDADLQRLMVAVTLGSPARGKALGVYELLMTYASAWRQTGGLAVALTRPGGDLVLQAPFFAAELNPRSLVTIVTNMARRAVILRGMIAAGAAEQEASVAMPIENAIRL